MSLYQVEIDGDEYDVLKDEFDVRLAANALETFSVAVDSEDGSASFQPRSEMVLKEDGVPIVGGIITESREEGFGDITGDSIVTHITATGFSIYLTYAYATVTLAAGTLKSMLTTLVADYLTTYSITLHGSQVDGPTLPELTYTRKRIDAIMNELAERAGYTWKVNPDKTLRMQAVGVVASPFNLINSGPVYQTGDVSVQTALDDTYANRIRGLVTGAGPAESTEEFLTVTDGDVQAGYTDYLVKYPASLDVNGQIWPNGGIFGPQGWGGPDANGDIVGAVYEWTWLPHLNPSRLRHNDADYGTSTPDLLMTLRYGIRYPFEVIVEDSADIALYGVREKIVEIPQAMSYEAATAYIQAILDNQTALIQTVSFKTRTPGLRPGQVIGIDLPTRHVNDDFLITSVKMSVEATEAPGDDLSIFHEVEAITGSSVKGQFQQVYKDWLGNGESFSGGVSQAAGAGPAAPERSVQFHRVGGMFGGTEHFKFFEDESTIVCGELSTVDALSHRSCQVFGYDCHIGDP